MSYDITKRTFLCNNDHNCCLIVLSFAYLFGCIVSQWNVTATNNQLLIFIETSFISDTHI